MQKDQPDCGVTVMEFYAMKVMSKNQNCKNPL